LGRRCISAWMHVCYLAVCVVDLSPWILCRCLHNSLCIAVDLLIWGRVRSYGAPSPPHPPVPNYAHLTKLYCFIIYRLDRPLIPLDSIPFVNM
jgi:hypothetical protein